ncbi:MAG: ABC transporter ATP-binding protein [Desulfobulbus sp.]|nr:ABC transporter ATP-binding protein [Desulfobulbus sp.]
MLRRISLSIQAGEVVCLIGRSGCGKSTLLKMVAGFLAPTQGQCLLAGRRIVKPGPDRCVVFQEDALFPWLTVREDIAFGLGGGSGAQRHLEAERWIDLVGLAGYGDSLPRTLSGGMKQRVALARVLIRSPQILLMDEPFGALDAQTREEMQELLLRLAQERNQTILFVTHDVQEAVIIATGPWFWIATAGRLARQCPLHCPAPAIAAARISRPFAPDCGNSNWGGMRPFPFQKCNAVVCRAKGQLAGKARAFSLGLMTRRFGWPHKRFPAAHGP